jgi:entericidin B
MKKIFTMLGIVALTVGLSACNTFRGMGEDMEAGGEKVQGAATETQEKM